MTSNLLSTDEVAAYLRVHRRTVLHLIASGKLRATNVGGTKAHGARYRVSAKNLDRYVEERTT